MLTIGVMEAWDEDGATFGSVIGLLVLCSAYVGLGYYALQIHKVESRPEATTDVDSRLGKLERRLSDIQDIVISIDDQLRRQAATESHEIPNA